ncbi:unnamed protein product [Protopolystoma xenopodis]|uniref:Secreted protein n=1 Tax=Protopolystoma xenopodis TaxID=117903 RepID=A0A448WJC3_9PLAT|nr:unnamed protein product [Protopolystoma xenopodis]
MVSTSLRLIVFLAITDRFRAITVWVKRQYHNSCDTYTPLASCEAAPIVSSPPTPSLWFTVRILLLRPMKRSLMCEALKVGLTFTASCGDLLKEGGV